MTARTCSASSSPHSCFMISSSGTLKLERPGVACQRRADLSMRRSNLSMRRSTEFMKVRPQVASTVVGDSKASPSPASDHLA